MKISAVMVFSVIIFFLYNYYAFCNVSKILIDFKRKNLPFLSLACLNTLLMVLAYYLKIPYYVSYFIVLVTLTIEFSIFSKSSFSQIFLCSGIIVINISAPQIFFVAVYSLLKNVTPYELFYNQNLFFSNLSLLFIFLFIMLAISNKIIPKEDIIKLSTTKIYSVMVSLTIIFMLLYMSIDIIFLQNEEYTNKLVLFFISSALLTIFLFYVLFFYSIKSVKIVQFKEKSDSLEFEKNKNFIDKKNLETKLYKDSLACCYNRKFIMSYLKNLEKNNIHNFTILFIDVDKLKFVNDTFGHNEGDKYIVEVSNCVKNAITENDIVARIGGDEFLVVLNYIEEESIINILNKIKTNVDYINSITPKYLVSISIGYVIVNKDLLKKGIENIIKIADENMRIIKKSSKGDDIKC